MREIRNNEQINSSSENRHVSGYAVVFNSESKDLGGFTEIISRSAISQETLDNSDILFLLDHNKNRGILARSKNGNGSLKMEIDDRGVKFSFEAPETSLGEEILIGLRRGDISQCSFAFTVAEDRWEKRSDGSILRTIENINELYDMSLVFNPAYDATIAVNKRGLEELMKEEEIRNQEEEKEVKETEEKQPENDTPKEEEKEEKSAEEETEKETSEEEDKENKTDEESEENKEEKSCDKEDEKRSSEIKIEDNNLYNKEEINKRNHKFMEKQKRFSLISTINDAINKRSNDFIKDGKIVLPLEMRAEGDVESGSDVPVTPNGILAGVETQGQEVIPTQMFDLMTSLKDKMILSDLGATFITANGVLEFPKYDAGQAGFVGEIDHAVDAAGKFESVKLTPLRLSAYMDVSNTWLNLNSANAEAVLRQEIVNCIALKLQQTIFGNQKGDQYTPQGLFYGVTADTADFGYEDAVGMEEALESANVYGDFKYAMSPKCKYALRTKPIDKGSGKFVFESNEVLGVPALSTNSVVNKGIILGEWSQFVIAFFGGSVRMTIDDISRAVYNQTRIVLSLDVNYIARRPEALIKRIMK